MLFEKDVVLPDDLKKLNKDELEALAAEIRTRLVDIVSKNGGHLASNLGVVELTIAMYTYYNPFVDRIVWDVGHQTYVHKILTGRDAEMDSIRQYGGLSGFPKTEESKADSFNTGHSSTSISAALGMARAMKITGKNYKVAAVIGDGALTGGMAFEALNDLSQSTCDVTVILNDNGMSISKNVGGLSQYLGGIRSKRSYAKAKKNVKSILEKIPLIGKFSVRVIRRLKRWLKFLIVPGEFFEDLGIEYLGPIDGHNISAIQDALERAESIKGPVVLHVITKKGVGYKPAEEKPEIFHGISPFDKETGETPKSNVESFSSGFAMKLAELAESDEKIAAVTAAMPLGTGLECFAENYSDRFFDVGIAEQHAVTMAAGMSICGAKPVIAVYSTFLQRGYDQLLHDVALQNLPLVIALDRSGINGQDGETHQGIYDFAYLGHLPNINIAAPCSIRELREMLEIAIRVYDSNPENPSEPHGCFVVRYPAKERIKEHSSLIEYSPVEFGKGCVIFDSVNTNGDGSLNCADLCIMSVGAIAEEAILAAEALTLQGVSVRVFNARFVKPLDEQGIIEQAQNAKHIITVEEAVRFGGFGEQAELLLLKNGINIPLSIIALPDENIPHGKISEIQKEFGLDATGIVSAYKKLAGDTSK